MISLLGLDPATYARHPIHGAGRTYGETNCYTDIVIELLHARGDEPLAMLGFLVRLDFEGDQFTFFKPPPSDLETLYGVDIHEMNPWRAIPDQAVQQLGLGRTMIVELDAFHLPDVHATDYRTNHVKTSVIVEGIDRDAQRLHYWHNAGLHALEGEDYRGVFRLGDGLSPDVLVPYCDVVRFDAGPRLEGEELRAAARTLLGGHLNRRPGQNPFEAFATQLTADLPALLAGDAAGFHAYAFPTVRMAGAASELLADHARWLAGTDADDAVEALGQVMDACKVLSFRLARRRAFEPEPILAGAATGWTEALAALEALAA